MRDALAAQVGGIGISPGANINYLTGHAIFEAIHRTAPNIAGKDIANPCSVLLSGCILSVYGKDLDWLQTTSQTVLEDDILGLWVKKGSHRYSLDNLGSLTITYDDVLSGSN